MNQKTTDHPDLDKGEEVENFTKVVKSSSGQLAIVDASVLKDLQNPLAKEAVIFPTKQTPGQDVFFKVAGKFDDAILREMVMSPATTEEIALHQEKQEDKEAVQDTKDKQAQVSEGIQILGHDRRGPRGSQVTGTVAKEIAKVETLGKGKKATRGYRNRLASKKNRPVVSPSNTVSSRMAERVSVKGAQRDNYGQGHHKILAADDSVSECIEFFRQLKAGTLSEEFIGKMKYFDQLHSHLSEMRKLPGPHSDFIHESFEKLEAFRVGRISREADLIEELIREGIPLD